MGEKCRTGCKEKSHASYAECLRSAAPQVGPMWTRSKETHRDLNAYVEARRQGVQPDGTRSHQIERAMRISDATGVAYNGGLD